MLGHQRHLRSMPRGVSQATLRPMSPETAPGDRFRNVGWLHDGRLLKRQVSEDDQPLFVKDPDGEWILVRTDALLQIQTDVGRALGDVQP